MCDGCRYGTYKHGKTDKQAFEEIATPYWVHAGQKPNAQDKAKLKYMKEKNMTWGDLKMERDMKYAKTEGDMKDFLAYKNGGGSASKEYEKS